MIDLTLLGCGGNVPMPNRFLSSLFINYKGRKMLIDCGEGTQVAMKKYNCGFKTIDLILITHLHGDHIIGLIGLLQTMGNSGKTDDLTIVGPVGITDAMNAIKVLVEYLPYRVYVIENPKEKFSLEHDILKDIDISTIDLEHSTECIGYSLYFKRKAKFDRQKAMSNEVPQILWKKLQEQDTVIYNDKTYYSSMVLGDERKGIKLSFITDTRPTFEIPQFIYGSDLFICEGMYGDDLDISKAVKNKHMTFREAASLANAGNVDKLLLTHFSPSIEEPKDFAHNATNLFKDTIIGEDGLSLSLSYKD
ncbi:ribonuclease Z [Intestinibacter bartlettii]|uniref:Ribonuclease Z n=1 Tax=Intestinibacter bartlettii TaxID=261299 RepID=A0ABS8CTB4_9FIRM|nr:ribonuclease Z [Intestinibacter bartlettii]MCB5395871.1 ribonuclease Z [Intestinibacter bartlettii]MCB5402420.1 ribonuclease Z [Intestinibacter bartlettii]MCB5444676.1 ribonuclease Z [Intestinibacter bartlettii]MCB5719774.1 ribonuclease Z [Intestinibacter bartlettii]MCB5747710.1 ribonuclease Z [Intestinibacter bartlettii]